MKQFTPEQIQAAREVVADFWAQNARDIRHHDAYASHVTETKKEENLENQLLHAEEIRAGLHDSKFYVHQRLMMELTGECVALLP